MMNGYDVGMELLIGDRARSTTHRHAYSKFSKRNWLVAKDDENEENNDDSRSLCR
jgi:hypothetical protein